MSTLPSGDLLPAVTVPPPGPASRQLADRLRRVESPNVTSLADDFPIFWLDALGANVLDVDGNIYIDLTAGFGVAAAGHRNPRVVDAAKRQLDSLPHGMGDVHPPAIKVQLLERLARVTPGDLAQSILASSGSEAVEAALKTARLASGKPGVLCFSGAYHGLTYGALAVTAPDLFRAPFADQLGVPVARLPFPVPRPTSPPLDHPDDPLDLTLQLAARCLDADASIGAIIVEPILGRGGVVVPPPGFLRGLRRLSDERGLILIFDEVYTGFGRTGRWFACQHDDVLPDLLCLGKSLTGMLPFSACIGRPEVMAAWPASHGEAIHTSTFLGNPVGCAAALAQIDELESRQLVERAARLGDVLLGRLHDLQSHCPAIGDVRGRGLLVGVELVGPQGAPQPQRARRLVVDALRRGLILLSGGERGNVLELSPPLTITDEQLDASLVILEGLLKAV